MKILFVILHAGELRYFESAIRVLGERGHAVHLAFNIPVEPKKKFSIYEAERLAKQNKRITFSTAPLHRNDLWWPFAKTVRWMIDYLYYLNPAYDNFPYLKERVAKHLPFAITFLLEKIHGGGKHHERILLFMKCFKILEEFIPSSRKIEKFIKYHDPDILLITPLIFLASDQTDFIKSAKSMRIRNALCVLSWDNLTSKGVIKAEPDKIIVWNERQKKEARDLHGIDSSKIIVTGAHTFDEWFERRPSCTREEFCQKVGILPERPFVLYLGSSVTQTPGDKGRIFVGKWIKKLRKSGDPELNRVGVLIRPHPYNVEQWKNFDSSCLENVSVWPIEGATTENEEAKADFFDSLYYSFAAVGINTSALIEAGIVGRPVYTLLLPEFKHAQEGMLHFHYLVEGGLLHTSDSYEEHLNQLSKALNSGQDVKVRDFIENFVRPKGIDVPCASILADSVETIGKSNTEHTEATPWWLPFLRFILFPFVFFVSVAAFLYKMLKNPVGKKRNRT